MIYIGAFLPLFSLHRCSITWMASKSTCLANLARFPSPCRPRLDWRWTTRCARLSRFKLLYLGSWRSLCVCLSLVTVCKLLYCRGENKYLIKMTQKTKREKTENQLCVQPIPRPLYACASSPLFGCARTFMPPLSFNPTRVKDRNNTIEFIIFFFIFRQLMSCCAISFLLFLSFTNVI